MVGLAIGASAAASLVGSGISAMGAQSAAKTQADAAMQAAELQNQRYVQTRNDLSPFTNAGQANLGPLQSFWGGSADALGNANAAAGAMIPQNVNASTIQNMPGYQFNLDQGLKAVQNSAAAKGLGISGQAMKQGSNFASGLANQYYQNYFNNAQTRYSDTAQQFQNTLNASNAVFNQLYTPAAMGENAAAQTGVTGANLANTQGGLIAAAGQAQAAGIGTAAGAINQGLSGAGNNALTYAMLNNAGLAGSSGGAIDTTSTF